MHPHSCLRPSHPPSPYRRLQVGLFAVGGPNYCGVVADLPGYGFARHSQDVRRQFKQLVLDYCFEPTRLYTLLQRVMILVDSR